MTLAREYSGPNIIVDETDEVRSKHDVDPDVTVPPDNSFIIGRDYTLPEKRAREAWLESEAEWDALQDQNPGVFVTFEQLYKDELKLMEIISGANMRAGFKKAHRVDADIQERYGYKLPEVAKGADANHKRMVNHDILDVYHAQELKDVKDENGRDAFLAEQIDHDARTTMRTEYQAIYGGIDNEKARSKRKRWLNKKLSDIATNNAV